MLVLTIQRRDIVGKILNGTYHVNLWQSPYVYQSIRFTEGYNKILNELERKTKTSLIDGESCYWGWVKNPYIDFFNYNKDEYVALFVDIPKSEMVFSDYDKYTDYVLENSNETDFIVESITDSVPSDCVQCSFLSLDPSNIKLTVPLSMLNKGCKSVSDMYHAASCRYIWFYLNRLNQVAIS